MWLKDVWPYLVRIELEAEAVRAQQPPLRVARNFCNMRRVAVIEGYLLVSRSPPHACEQQGCETLSP
jgi:hypothetical protein